MQEKIKLTPELNEMLEFIQEIMPSEDGKKLSKEETLKMVLATFIAFVTQEEEEEHNHNHHCNCKNWHCH